MNKIDFKKRFTNKTFIVSFVSTIILLLQQLGLGDYLPNNIMEIINTILLLLVMLGVVIDPSTSGITDGENKEVDK